MGYVYDPKGYDPSKSAAHEIPPAGAVVKCEIMQDGTEIGTSKSSGKSMLTIKLEICKGEQGAGTWMRHYIVLEGEWAAQNIGRLFAALGWPTDKARPLNVCDLIGKRVTVKVKHEQYEGQTRAKVSYLVARMPKDEPELGGQGEDTPPDDSAPTGDVDGKEAEGLPF
ncbi:MAG: hypothetical protein AAB403_07710 [Planctomycetota bacterium]